MYYNLNPDAPFQLLAMQVDVLPDAILRSTLDQNIKRILFTSKIWMTIFNIVLKAFAVSEITT